MLRVRPRRLLLWAFEAMAGLLALLGGVFLLGFWALNQRWIYSDELTPFAENMLTQVSPGFEAKIGDVEAIWHENGAYALIRLHDVILLPEHGGRPSTLKRVDVSLSLTALLVAQLAPSRLAISGAKINLRQPKIAAPQSLRSHQGLTAVLSKMGRFFAFPISGETPALAYLHEMDMRDVDISLLNPDGLVQWKSQGMSLSLSRPYLKQEARFRAQARIGTGEDTGEKSQLLKITGKMAPHEDRVRIDLMSDHLPARFFEPVLPGLKRLADLDVNMQARFQLDMTPDGIFHSWRGKMKIQEGGILTPVLLMPLQRMKNIFVDVYVDFDQDVLELHEFSFENPQRRSANKIRSKLKGKASFTAFTEILASEEGADEESIRHIVITADFTDMELVYFKGMRPLHDATGSCFLREGLLRCNMEKGYVLFGKERLAVQKSLFEISDISALETRAAIDFEARGTPNILGRWLDSFPYNRLKTGYLFDAASEGQGTIKADVHWRYRYSEQSDRDISFNIEIEMQDLKTLLRLPDFQMPIDEGDLSISLTEEAFAINGHMRFGGAVTHVSHRGKFTGPAGTDAKLKLDMLINQDLLRFLDLKNLLKIDGEAHLIAELSNRRARDSFSGQARLDLTAPSLSQPHSGWLKKKGEKSDLRFNIIWGPKGIAFNDIFLSSSNMAMRGIIKLNPQGELVAAKFPTIKVGNRNSASFDLRREKGGVLFAHARLAHLDLRNVDFSFSSVAEREGQEPLRGGDRILLNAQIGQVIGYHATRFSSVGVEIYLRNRQIDAFDVRGLVKSKGKTSLWRFLMSQPHKDKQRRLLIKTDNAGAILRGLDIYEDLRGGTMFLTAKLPQDKNVISGKAVIRKFHVSQTPIFTQILGAASLAGLTSAISGRGIFFNRMELSFTQTPEQILLHEGWAVGSALGVSLRGAYQRKVPNKISINGTLTPAYIINSFLGTIPGLGKLLTNRKGEGVFGISFAIGGTGSEPQVSVNPLSTMTPGILRQLFEFGEENSKVPKGKTKGKTKAPSAKVPPAKASTPN